MNTQYSAELISDRNKNEGAYLGTGFSSEQIDELVEIVLGDTRARDSIIVTSSISGRLVKWCYDYTDSERLSRIEEFLENNSHIHLRVLQANRSAILA